MSATRHNKHAALKPPSASVRQWVKIPHDLFYDHDNAKTTTGVWRHRISRGPTKGASFCSVAPRKSMGACGGPLCVPVFAVASPRKRAQNASGQELELEQATATAAEKWKLKPLPERVCRYLNRQSHGANTHMPVLMLW